MAVELDDDGEIYAAMDEQAAISEDLTPAMQERMTAKRVVVELQAARERRHAAREDELAAMRATGADDESSDVEIVTEADEDRGRKRNQPEPARKKKKKLVTLT